MPFGLSSLISNKLNKDAAKKINRMLIRLANTAHQREVKDLRKAGLNPILSTGGSGASTPSLSTPQQSFDLTGGASEVAGTYFDGFSARSTAERNLADIGVAQAQKEQITTATQGQKIENANKPIRQKLENANLQREIDLKTSGKRVADSNYEKNMAEAKSIAEDTERKMFENNYLFSPEGTKNYKDQKRLAAIAPTSFQLGIASAKELAEEIRNVSALPSAEREIDKAVKSSKKPSEKSKKLLYSPVQHRFNSLQRMFDPHGERLFRGW